MATDEPPPFFISLSQEEKLRTSKYQGQVDSDSDDSLDISVSSTPIVMESLPHQEGGGNWGATADGHLPKDFASADGIQTGEGCNRCSETVPTLPPEFVESMEILKGLAAKGAVNAPPHAGEKSATNVHRDIAVTDSDSGLLPEALEIMKILKGYVAKSAINAPSRTGEESTCFASTSSTDVGEAVKTGGGAAYSRVEETAENVVKAGGGVSDGRKARGIKRSLKQDLLAMLTQTMRVTGQCQRKSGAQRVGILETAKRMGMKFPKPEHWPPGKEL